MLGWQYRKQNLLKELLGYSADIVCLQEVRPPSMSYCVQCMLAVWSFVADNLLGRPSAWWRRCRLTVQVQSTHFADFWAPELGKAGYTAIFKKKTAEVPVAQFA